MEKNDEGDFTVGESHRLPDITNFRTILEIVLGIPIAVHYTCSSVIPIIAQSTYFVHRRLETVSKYCVRQ